MAPSIVKVFREIPGFCGVTNSATKTTLNPDVYLIASGENLFLTICISWILGLIFNLENIKNNPLRDRLGYNNVCVAWDEPPALYFAAVLFQGTAYCAVRYAILDFTRSAIDDSTSTAISRFVQACNMLYAVSTASVCLIFVVTPNWNPVWHTISFGQFVLCR